MMKQNRFFTFRVLLACLPLLLCGIQAHAWDSQPDVNGRYDKFLFKVLYGDDFRFAGNDTFCAYAAD